MQIILQLAFALLFGFGIFLFGRNIRRIRRNILLGKDFNSQKDRSEAIRDVLLLAFGQKKMFKKPLVALLHLVVYVGFIIVNIELLEIILDGLLGTHRIFAPSLGNLYTYLINCFEILAVMVIVVCAIFLIRRNILKVKRLSTGELGSGWPKKDGNLILIMEIILMGLFLKMNASDLVLQSRGAAHYIPTESFLISQHLTSFFESFSTPFLIILERLYWWIHIAGILFFMNYLAYSKHLHILLAFPNAYYANPKPKGTLANMPEIQNEILLMMQPEQATEVPATDTPPSRFGAKDVMDLSWKNLLDAYTCTECGRCSSACPANQTGKKLSPRKIMMDTRDRLEEVGGIIDKNGSFVDDRKSLVHDYISVEELRACTTCNACVEECPVSINPLSIILELRRYLVMEESNAPQEWNLMFSNIENNFAPWKFSPDDRDAWRHS